MIQSEAASAHWVTLVLQNAPHSEGYCMRTVSRCLCLAVWFLVALCCHVGIARANLIAEWSGGGTNAWLSGVGGERCTVIVRRVSPVPSTVQTFLLAWCGDGALTVDGQEPYPLDFSSSERALTESRQTSNESTLQELSFTGDSALVPSRRSPCRFG